MLTHSADKGRDHNLAQAPKTPIDDGGQLSAPLPLIIPSK